MPKLWDVDTGKELAGLPTLVNLPHESDQLGVSTEQSLGTTVSLRPHCSGKLSRFAGSANGEK
jgi:hypothetical protein